MEKYSFINTGETRIKRMIAFRKESPKVNGGCLVVHVEIF